ncbi:MarR family winged helix-turn-helix transcriptional regulator [Blastococcus litoris]|uniref:MarR family winged helix-turn-helix transcriptional regulator n=1 Tax=Blastococcus litoris TaxID=2171622 RepID=UPI0013DFB49E|nr:MarR family transcriptional regulator [Blastococcus litoris]
MNTAEDDALLRLARTVVGASMRAADQLGQPSVVQLRAVGVLDGLGVANLGRLAADLGIAVSTTSRLVDRLVAAGLVDRRQSPHSRREVALSVTPRGSEVLGRYDELRLGELRDLLAGLPANRRPEVVAALAEFAGAATEVQVR